MKVKIVLRNPLNKTDQIDYTIAVDDHALADRWIIALKKLLTNNNLLEKNFCFLGFPNTHRTLEYLCTNLSRHVSTINQNLKNYRIEEVFTPDTVVGFDYAANGINHEVLNKLHNHFEILQGTVWNLSQYYKLADYETKYAIRQLNLICHELESLILSRRKAETNPEWVRPSQITTWINAERYALVDELRTGFLQNGYDRKLGGVYMHWAQIGKTLFEVWRDENAPELTDTVCAAITHLEYYSGEFDIEWGKDLVYGNYEWHDSKYDEFKQWLIKNNLNPEEPKLSLGYLPLGQVELLSSFGTTDHETIWKLLGQHLDIYMIEVDGVAQKYDYCWSDVDYEQQQIDQMKPGYDYHLRTAS